LRILKLGLYTEWDSYTKWCEVYLGHHIEEIPLIDMFPAPSIGPHQEMSCNVPFSPKLLQLKSSPKIYLQNCVMLSTSQINFINILK